MIIIIILVVTLGFFIYKLFDKKAFVKQINMLQEEINSKIGSFITKGDETKFIGKAQLLKEIAIRKKYTFDESAMFISFADKLKQTIYDNNLMVLENKMQSYLETFTESVGAAKEYIISPDIELHAEQFQMDMKKWVNWSEGYESPVIKNFNVIYDEPQKYLLNLNAQYLEEEKEACNKMLSDIDGKSLDENQRNAVVNDDLHQLVIAGAGSGKTLTIAAKVKYLVERKEINPKDILLISFTRKAANEMGDRIRNLGIDVDSSTFHQYGLKVIRSVNKKTPDIADDIGRYIEIYLKDVVYNDNKLAKDFLILLGTLMLPVFDGYETIGERIEAEQRQDLTTIKGMYEAYANKVKSGKLDKQINELNGKLAPLSDKLKKMSYADSEEHEYFEVQEMIHLLENEIYKLKNQKRSIRNETMKSSEEVILANMFFLDGVKYQYEAEYKFDESDNYRKKYRPDFYLEESDVYWEHFGIDERNRAHQYSTVTEKQYLEGVEWKRNIHKINSTRLAETYSWQFAKNKIVDAVNNNYIKFNIKKHKINYCDVIKEILKGDEVGNIESFKSLLSTFISLFKSYGYSSAKFEELRKRIIEYKDDKLSKDALERRKTRDLLVLEFAEKFYGFYTEMLIEEQKIDFNDMIIQAAGHIDCGTYIPEYKYVIIDEYQDISKGRYLLVKATLEKSGAKLFCVGDDWQSIYRFTGSEVELLVNFEKYFGLYSRTDIVKTYRNSQELLDISGKFIMSNTYQNTKKLYSDKRINDPIRVSWYTGTYRPILEKEEDEKEIKLSQAFREAVASIVKKCPEGEILVLGRNNSDLKLLADDKGIHINRQDDESFIVIEEISNIKMKYLTVHRAKGLEADNVIIINARNARTGFPNQIVDDPILNILRETTETYPFAEERRLFYVALTRTKNYTYILAPLTKASRFLDEIKKSDNIIGINDVGDVYPRTTTTRQVEVEKTSAISCPVCKVGTLVKRTGADGKEFVSCSNYPACNYTNANLDAVRQNNRCPVCDNFLVNRKGEYGEFIGCMSYPYCNYSADIVIEHSSSLHNAKQQNERTWQYYNQITNNGRYGWTVEEDYQLKREFEANKSITQIARNHNRTTSDISTRLKKLGLL